MTSSPISFGHRILQNWKAGLTVSLVSVPLSISLAIAAGATPVMGIITAIWAGLIAAIFGGSNYNIVGPTGALSGILATLAIRYGVAVLPIVAILTGIATMIVYFLRWDRYIVFIPSSVTHGFTLGVAFIIALNQMNFALGITGLTPHERLMENVMDSVEHVGSSQMTAVVLFVLSLISLFVLSRFVKKVPAPIIVAAVGIGLGYGGTMGMIPWQFQTLFTKYGTMTMSAFSLPELRFPPVNIGFVESVIAVAVVAILETLLSAKIADGMTHTRHDQRREVLGLGLANIASGLAGGIPATAALARTALNVKSGAKSRMSGALNSVFVLLISLLFFGEFQYLPLPSVAAILVYVAIRMVEPQHWMQLFRLDRTMFILALVVAAITVLRDPIVGILAGSTIALLIFIQHLSTGRSDITIHRDKKVTARLSHHDLHHHDDHGDITVYRFAGELTYFNAESHERSIKRLRCRTLILSLRNLFYIDVDGLHALEHIIKDRERHGINVMISATGPYNETMLRKTAWFRAIADQGSVYPSTTAALTALGYPLR